MTITMTMMTTAMMMMIMMMRMIIVVMKDIIMEKKNHGERAQQICNNISETSELKKLTAVTESFCELNFISCALSVKKDWINTRPG